MGSPENQLETWGSSFDPAGRTPPLTVELEDSGEQSRSRPAFASRVRRLIEEELSGGNPSKEHIADRLGMSARTLCRRLAADGTSFIEVLNDLRRELALGYLEHRTESMSEVASRLGFSSVSAFGRAFRRWTGLSPTAYGQNGNGEDAHECGSGAENGTSPQALSGSPVGASRQTD